MRVKQLNSNCFISRCYQSCKNIDIQRNTFYSLYRDKYASNRIVYIQTKRGKSLPWPGVPTGVLVRLLLCGAMVTWSSSSVRFIRLFISAFVLDSEVPLLRCMVFTSWKNFSLLVAHTLFYYTMTYKSKSNAVCLTTCLSARTTFSKSL